MRLISTLCLLLLSSVCFSQLYEMIRKSEYEKGNYSTQKSKLEICGMRGSLTTTTDISAVQSSIVKKDSLKFVFPSGLNILPAKNDTSEKPATIRLRCAPTFAKDGYPLIVIDGFPLFSNENLPDIKPDDIESVEVLKKSAFPFSCNIKPRSVILITTKKIKFRKFTIKDFLDGNIIPGATVSFISADKKDTIMMAANDSGVVVTDKLQSLMQYQVYVSATGYKLLMQSFKKGYDRKEQEFMMERDVKLCDEVILGGGRLIRCSRNSYCRGVSRCSLHTVADTAYSFSFVSVKAQMVAGRVFPNPTQKGQAITIETASKSEGPIQIKLTSLGGKLLLSQSQKVVIGLSRFTLNTDPRWAAGIYFLQLYANGKLLASDKLVIQ